MSVFFSVMMRVEAKAVFHRMRNRADGSKIKEKKYIGKARRNEDG
ncbi:MAG: hypothetical protein P9L88_05225 [Candidatus Tantalella remota]|nr:hypothetical protein [Candidatus Tantalella remota]